MQGRENAPPVVKACLNSWEKMNPGWELRVLDQYDAVAYAPRLKQIDLRKKDITATAYSDILRIYLLHEYGGVWVDATTFCNLSLDAWLPDYMSTGFFAFKKSKLPISSWFLASEENNYIVAAMARATSDYWARRSKVEHYYWFHRIFARLLKTDKQFSDCWGATKSKSAHKPHAALKAGLARPYAEVCNKIDWSTPVFKLTYKFDRNEVHSESLLNHFLEHKNSVEKKRSKRAVEYARTPRVAGQKVATDNLGDHIQILAARQLMDRFGLVPEVNFDRDKGLGSARSIEDESDKFLIMMNGWFKRGNGEWPPNNRLDPIFMGFHIRPRQSAVLTAPETIEYYKNFGPIGCRDSFTTGYLKSSGVPVVESNCLTLTFPKRLPSKSQTEVFVVSRDDRLSKAIAPIFSDAVLVNHYSGDKNFQRNMKAAQDLLTMYRRRAKLVVTSLLHCALPCLAMGIPVVMFAPMNSAKGHESDMERFSSLKKIVKIHDMNRLQDVDWDIGPAETGKYKLALVDLLKSNLDRRGVRSQRVSGPFARLKGFHSPELDFKESRDHFS